MDGHFVELNDAWTRHLGYTLEELRGDPLPRASSTRRTASATEAEAAALFRGGETLDASRTASGPRTAAGTGCAGARSSRPTSRLIYGRAADVTELKQIEGEREELLGQVQDLARHDSLTGLPNRRAPGGTAAAGDGPRPAPRSAALPGDRRHRPLQGLQRHTRSPGRRRGAARLRPRVGHRPARRGHAGPLRRRGVPRPAPRHRARAGGGDRRAAARADAAGADLLGRARALGLHREHRRPAAARRRGALPGQGRRPRPAGAGRADRQPRLAQS